MADVNPYASPIAPLRQFGGKKYVMSQFRDRCPVCSAIVDPWKVGNSIRLHRCSECSTLLWMGTSTMTSVICMSLPLVLIGVWYLVLPRNTIVLGCSLVGLGMAFTNIFVRILFGRPVAKRMDWIKRVDASIGQRENSTNNPMDRSGRSDAS